MHPFYFWGRALEQYTVHHGDCLEILRTFKENSIDSIVTDPPYGFRLMGQRWDYDVPSVEIWAECLRVLKPGGHMLAFAGARTQHRMACRIEDAGFEIRDMLAWLHGNGFPKSGDVSDEMAAWLSGARPAQEGTTINPDIYKVTGYLRAARDAAGWTNAMIDALFGTRGMAGHWTTAASQPAVPSPRQWATLKSVLDLGDDVDDLVERFGATERPEDWGHSTSKSEVFLEGLRGAKMARTQDWGTALKPAIEPITLARKPLAGTARANVAAWGVGGLHIAGCWVDGRWPANVAHDGALARDGRYYYCAKASRADRGDGNTHPTVKPTELMRWLVRMVTPPGGLVLDPFTGSGSTGKAAALEGVRFVGCERGGAFVDIARRRIAEAAGDRAPANALL